MAEQGLAMLCLMIFDSVAGALQNKTKKLDRCLRILTLLCLPQSVVVVRLWAQMKTRRHHFRMLFVL
ncbi:hypothetical protein PF008_g9137 [Phytophthora fragariae]|uniref:Secreted protein n=1 Tax=Phytophthora fragariae TaxID=53985 RepID=A0A6G0RY40_9STRA|nr:hypothetical protein PF008_g9137 [Phytophthora fragariae]